MILCTGGCGFLGQHIVKALLDHGDCVRVLDNYSRGSHKWLGAEYKRADVRYDVDLSKAVARPETQSQWDEIIHLAYINGTPNFYRRPDEVLEVAVKGIINVIDLCRIFEIRKLTLVSSSEVCRAKLVDTEEAIPLVIPDPFNPRYSYSAGKIISEMLAIHNAPRLFDRLLIARPFNIYGPGMAEGHVIPDFIAKLRKTNGDGELFEMLGDGSETRSFCYIDDFIKGFMLMRKRGEHMGIYNIGTPVEITIHDLAIKLAAMMDKFVIVKSGKQMREGDAMRRKPDISRLAALGYRPEVSLDEGLRRMMT